MSKFIRVCITASCAVVLAACGATTPVASTSPSTSPSSAPSAPPSASPSTSPSASPSAMPSAVPSPTAGASLPIEGGTASRATITDVRVGTHEGYDRLVIEYTGGQPYFRITAQDPKTFVGPASGKPVAVAGNAGQHLYIFNMDIPPTFQHGTNLNAGFPELTQVVVMGVFEGQADIAIGLDHQAVPTISLYTAPYRLVIDYPTP